MPSTRKIWGGLVLCTILAATLLVARDVWGADQPLPSTIIHDATADSDTDHDHDVRFPLQLIDSSHGPGQLSEDSSLHWYSAQLHLHGWSNHNANPKPASLQAYTVWADSVNLDVLWWTEHNSIFNQVNDIGIDLSGATMDGLSVDIPFPPGTPVWAQGWYVSRLRATVTGNGTSTASVANGMLHASITDNDSSPSRLEYRGMAAGGVPVAGQRFPRPLVSDPVYSFDANLCGDTSADAYAEVRIHLSYHDYGGLVDQRLIYRLVPPNQPASVVATTNRITYTVPLTDTRVELPLLAHAEPLRDGEDNIFQEMYIALGSRNGAPACLNIGNFLLHSREPQPEHNYAEHREIAEEMGITYHTDIASGWEQFSGQRHINAFMPTSATLLPGLDDIQAPNFVPMVHNQGGLAMLNHPFGTGAGVELPPADQEALLQSQLDILLPVKAWGADLIETYLLRAQVNLLNHIRLWDLLATNGVPMCGASTSDQHGAPFVGPAFWTTWIEANSPDQDSLLASMRGCRMFFGNLERFTGVFDLTLDGVPMGGVHPVQEGVLPLRVIVDPLPAGAQIKLVQVALTPGRELTYIRDHEVIDPSQPVMIDVSQPSFVRAEMWTANNQPIVFTNRIALEPLVCDVNSDQRMSIADVQAVSAKFGENVLPQFANLDLWPDGVIDLKDIMRIADCWSANRSTDAPRRENQE